MKFIAALFVLLLVTSAACGQSVESAKTSGLTEVISEMSGLTFTWTLVNKTGPGDTNPEWDALVWSMQPQGLPAPKSVVAPEGWEWVVRGYSRFEIASPSQKYESGPAVPPGGQLVFKYEIDPFEAAANPELLSGSAPGFLMHVAAVLPEPQMDGDIARWIPTKVNGDASWYDVPTVRSAAPQTPEPSAVFAMLVWGTGTVGLISWRKRYRTAGDKLLVKSRIS